MSPTNSQNHSNTLATSPINKRDSLESSPPQSLTGPASAKASPPVLDLLSGSKAEPSVSASNDHSQDGERAARTRVNDSASQTLETIIRKSKVEVSPELDDVRCSNTVQPDDEHATSLPPCDDPPTTQLTAPFVGTMLEGHVFTPSSTMPRSEMHSEQVPAEENAAADPKPSTLDSTERPVTTMDGSAASLKSGSTNEHRSSLMVFAEWWSGGSLNSTNPDNTTDQAKKFISEQGLSVSTSSTVASTSALTSAATLTTSNDALPRLEATDSMEWEPTGPEAASLHSRTHPGYPSSSSAPSSLPSSATFPASLIKHSRFVESTTQRRGSVSSTHSSLTSMLWSKLITSQDGAAVNGPSANDNGSTTEKVAKPRSLQDIDMTHHTMSSGLAVAPVHAKVSKKRWSLFSYSTTDEESEGIPTTKLRKRGDVLIEPESRPESTKEMTSEVPEEQAMAKAPSVDGSTLSPSEPTQPTTAMKTELANSSDERGPVAPALVGTSELNIVVPSGALASKNKSETTSTSRSSATYSWLSIIPGYGNKTDNNSAFTDQSPGSQKLTEYEEVEYKDIDGSVQPGEEYRRRAFAELTEDKSTKGVLISKENSKGDRRNSQATSQIKENENQRNTIVEEAGKAVDSLSKIILRKKNVVLPDYYDQYPDVRQSLIALPAGTKNSPAEGPKHERSSSIVKSAVNALSSLLFSRAATEQPPPLAKDDPYHQGTGGIRKVAIIGVHGWFPVKLIRTVIGEPTGTSKKFCDEMDLALKDYLKMHNVELESDAVTLIPLEGEGKVLDRVDILYRNLVSNRQWKQALHDADLVLVATHSQGTPTSTLLISRLINEGMLRVQENDPRMQRIGILAMAGISHGPFPFLKGNLIVRWFEADAAQELFEFMDSESHISKRYREALRIVLTSGVRFTVVASLEDQVVPLYSAIMTSIHHPSIVRAVYIDGASYQDDFLTNLISFSLRLRNSGVDDHGVLVHLSEVVAGSIYGEGHSTIYAEREVYMLAIRALLEPPASLTTGMIRSEPILHPFRAKQNLNPFYLPWGMRGVMDELKSLGSEVLDREMERLMKLYDEWSPVSKAMKEIKFRLEPLVGHAGIGKRRLASCIRSELAPDLVSGSLLGSSPINTHATSKSSTDVNFRTAEVLPLGFAGPTAPSALPVIRSFNTEQSPGNTSQAPMESVARYDLIVFMVNMSNRASWDECRHSLRQLDPGWFLGRCALVVTQVAAVSKYAFDRDDITDFIDGYYDVPTMWVNLDVDTEAALAALQLVRILEIGAGYRRKHDSGLIGMLTTSQVGETIAGPTTSAASSLWGSYRCSKLGSRLTATHVMMKSPEMYTVPITTLLVVEAEEEEVTGDDQ
ncbi:hypothetical protein BGX34_007780 [Mortierella sp. NVP85]|nr:hypothetical protein BGX34_007780 [Mortierella sp. NVP85]